MALGCSREEAKQSKIVLCLSKLTILEELQSISDHLEKEKLNLHGTIIVQTILEFNKPIKIVNSILSLDTNVLKGLLCNSMGSHITDSYVKSQFVGEKSREKLVRKLQVRIAHFINTLLLLSGHLVGHGVAFCALGYLSRYGNVKVRFSKFRGSMECDKPQMQVRYFG